MFKIKDLTGQRFGKRIVLGPAKRANGKGYHRIRWNFRCDCGYESTCLKQDLKRLGPCLMCGHEGPRPYRRKRPFEANYNALVYRAKHPVLITYDEFVSFTKIKNCHYCDAEIDWPEYRKRGKGGTGTNLDRKDSSRPYEMQNLVVACRRCNYAKNTFFTYSEWLQIGNLIRSWKEAEGAPIARGAKE